MPGYWVASREPVTKNPGRSRGPQGDHNPRLCSLEGASDFLCVLDAGCDPATLGVDSEITQQVSFLASFSRLTRVLCAVLMPGQLTRALDSVRSMLCSQALPWPGPSGTSRASQAASASNASAFVWGSCLSPGTGPLGSTPGRSGWTHGQGREPVPQHGARSHGVHVGLAYTGNTHHGRRHAHLSACAAPEPALVQSP